MPMHNRTSAQAAVIVAIAVWVVGCATQGRLRHAFARSILPTELHGLEPYREPPRVGKKRSVTASWRISPERIAWISTGIPKSHAWSRRR